MIAKIYDRTLGPVARWGAARILDARRAAMKDVLYVGVTGSCGKTSTKELIYAILSSQFPGVANRDTLNGKITLFKLALRMKPSDRFCLMELGVHRRGDMDQMLRLFSPDIGVVTNVGTDHYVSFRGADGVAHEKGKLVGALKPEGTAILNADDPNVIAMAEKTRAKVFTFGFAPDAMLRAEDVRAIFPEPLSFTAIFGTERIAVRTNFFGAHFVPNVLAALATGIVAGVPLEQAVRAVEALPVPDRRLNTVTDGRGVTFLLDTWKASMSSLQPALDLMRDATAQRKWIVIGMLSDYPGAGGDRYRKVAARCLEIAGGVVFTGPFASSVEKVKNPRGALFKSCATVREARDFLDAHVRPGDLVLLKSSGNIHLERLALDRVRPVKCWIEKCGRSIACSSCPRVRA